VRNAAEQLYAELTAAGIEVLLDDRDERPGVMFADLELIGIPHRIVIGDRGLKEGKVEYQGRHDAAAQVVPCRTSPSSYNPDYEIRHRTSQTLAGADIRGSGFVLCRQRAGWRAREEVLSASVRSMLQRAVSDQAAPKLAFASQQEAQLWLDEMSQRLAKRMPDARTGSIF